MKMAVGSCEEILILRVTPICDIDIFSADRCMYMVTTEMPGSGSYFIGRNYVQ